VFKYPTDRTLAMWGMYTTACALSDGLLIGVPLVICRNFVVLSWTICWGLNGRIDRDGLGIHKQTCFGRPICLLN